MARIKATAFSPDFAALIPEAQALGEANDCSVKAVALITGRPYAEVHAAFAACGRKKRRGTPRDVSRDTLAVLGVEFREWSLTERVALAQTYPPRAAGKSPRMRITTHHWRRFPASWAPHRGKRLIVLTSSHMLAVIDGEVRDWSINRALCVNEIWEVL